MTEAEIYKKLKQTIYNGLGAYCTHRNRSFDQWMKDRKYANKYFKKYKLTGK